MAAKVRYLFDGVYEKGPYVRAWKEKRNVIVQVWLSGEFLGDPDGDWEMPGALGAATCIAQAVKQTTKK